MKKTLLSLTMALLATVAFGQIEQGTKFLGGNFSYASGSSETTSGGTTVDGPESSMFEIAPSFGYMVSDNIGVGIRIGFGSETDTETGTDFSDPLNPVDFEDEDKTSTTEIGLFGRYYADVAGDNLFFHIDLGLDFGFGTQTNTFTSGGTSTESEVDLNSLRVGLTPGFDYFIGEKWAIEANWGFLGYESNGTEAEGGFETSASGFGIGFDFTDFNIGARWYF